ncbi:MAG: ABC transporter substrate-binding protein, partial [Pseudomonadota bacterium]|nr:ABC transporter substrate-binding protein [Pseudomonadota bacterium]
MTRKAILRTVMGWLLFTLVVGVGPFAAVSQADLREVKKSGVLRHIGIPYANFVTTSNSGLSVELVQNFAVWLGVEYKYVPSSWKTVIGDLTGKLVKAKGSEVDILGTTQIRGDLIGNGLTVLDWRRQVVDYSRQATFPTQVWVVARVDSALHPIVPSERVEDDIKAVKKLLKGLTILHKSNTCLDA